EAPQRHFAAANKDYEAGNFEVARKSFQKFVNDYPKDDRVPEARFLAELSDLRATVSSVMLRTDPQPSVNAWKRFLSTVKEPEIAPFAAKDRKGVDVWQTGVRLAEGVVTKANESFTEDDPTEAQKWLDE